MFRRVGVVAQANHLPVVVERPQVQLLVAVVGVQLDTTGQFKAEEIQKAGGLKEIQKFDTILLAFQALEQGKVDAIINDYPVNQYICVKRENKTTVVTKIKTDEQYGIGVNMDNSELLKKVNSALQTVIDDGTYKEIFMKWFGVEPPTQ